MQKRKMMVKFISLVLALTFITGQVQAGETLLSYPDDKLAASSPFKDTVPERTKKVQKNIAEMLEPGAIGNGQPLIDLASGILPKKVLLKDADYDKMALMMQSAMSEALRLYSNSKKDIPNKDKEKAEHARQDLVKLQNNLGKTLYPFEADVRSSKDKKENENYLLTFNLDEFNREEIAAVAIDLIDYFYTKHPPEIAKKRLAQVIFQVCVPEKTIIKEGIIDRSEHKRIYNEINAAIFGKEEVGALKKDIREFIDAKTSGKSSRAWSYGQGTPEELALLEAGRGHFNVGEAFNEGRAFEIYGHNKKDIEKLTSSYVQKSGIKIGADEKRKEISARLKMVQGLFELALNDDTLKAIVEEIGQIPEDEAKDAKAKEFFGLVQGLNVNDIDRIKKILVDNTRIVAVLAKEGSQEEVAQALATKGDFSNLKHDAIVSFAGRAQYEGSKGIEGGPRSIYLDLARLERFEKNIDQFRLWLIHEYKDLARGYHVDEKSGVQAAIDNVHKRIDLTIKDKIAHERKRLATQEKTRITISVPGANLGRFLNSPTVPKELITVMRSVFDKAVKDGVIADYFPVAAGQRVNIIISHHQGRGSKIVNSLVLNALTEAIRYAKDNKLYKYETDITKLSDLERAKEMRLAYGDTSFNVELGETMALAITDSGGQGATKVIKHRAWTDPRTSDAIPNVALARPGYYFELENRYTGVTRWVHGYDVPNLAALIKEGRYLDRSIRPLKRDEKGNPIPLRNKNYTVEELMEHLDDPIAYTFTETAGFEPKDDGDFNEATLVRLQQWKGPDSGEFNSPLFVSSPIVPKQDTVETMIPVSVDDLAQATRPDAVRVAYLGFEILPDGKLSDKRGYPTELADVFASPKFNQQREIGERLAKLWSRIPFNFEPRLKSGTRKAELENALKSAMKIEAVPNIPSIADRIKMAKLRGKVHTDSGFKCDEGALFGHDKTPIVFKEEHRKKFMDAWTKLALEVLSETAGEDIGDLVNRELIAAAIERALLKVYNQLASSGDITEAQVKELSEKANKLLNNVQGRVDPDKKIIYFPNEISKVGKILLTKDDARQLLESVVSQLHNLDDEVKARIIEEAFNDPAVYKFQRGDIISWFQWSVGDDTGINIANNLGKNHPALHTLVKDLYWEVVYRKGPELGVYGLAQDLSPEGATGNTKGTGIATSEIEVDEETAKEGTVIMVNDKSNAGAYSLALLEYLDTLDEAYLVRVLDPKPTGEAPNGTWYYYDSKTQRSQLQEVLGRIDRYSIYDIQALPGNKLFKEGQVVAAISSEKLFLIFGRYKGKDDAIKKALKRFLNPQKFGSILKNIYAIIGWNRGLNYGFYYLAPSWDLGAIAHDGPPLMRMLDLPGFDKFDPRTGELQGVVFEFDKKEYDQAREDAIFADRQLLLGTNPFEGGIKVDREAAEYNMAKVVEEDLDALGLSVKTIKQEFNTKDAAIEAGDAFLSTLPENAKINIVGFGERFLTKAEVKDWLNKGQIAYIPEEEKFIIVVKGGAPTSKDTGYEFDRTNRVLAQAKTREYRDVASYNLSLFTRPDVFRKRIGNILLNLDDNFKYLEPNEKKNVLYMLSYTAYLLSSPVIRKYTLLNPKYESKLRDKDIDTEVAKIIGVISWFERENKDIAQEVLKEWIEKLSHIQLKDVKKPLSEENPGIGLLAEWAKNAPKDSLTAWTSYWHTKISSSKWLKAKAVTGEISGNDYGPGTSMLIAFGVDLVMMNPTLAIRALAENKDLQDRVDEFIAQNPNLDKWELLAGATKIAGTEARIALRPIFHLTDGQRGRVSFQVNARNYDNRKEMVADILRLGKDLDEEASEIDRQLFVNDVITEGEYDELTDEELYGTRGDTNTFFKVDSSSPVVYGKLEGAILENITSDGKLDLAEVKTGGVIEEALSQGRDVNGTVAGHVADSVALWFSQMIGHRKAAKKDLQIHASIITQMLGRVEASLRWIAIQKVIKASESAKMLDSDKQFRWLRHLRELDIAKNGTLDDETLRQIAEDVGIRLPSDRAIRRVGAAILQRSNEILNALFKHFKGQGVKPWETGLLVAATREPHYEKEYNRDVFVHFEYTSGSNIRRGWFPKLQYSIESMPDTEFEAYLKGLKEFLQKNPNGVYKTVEPELIKEVLDSSVGEDFQKLYELNQNQAEILARLGIYKNEWGSNGLKVEEFAKHPFAQQTLFGKVYQAEEFGYNEKIPETEDQKNAVKTGFVADVNTLANELEAKAKAVRASTTSVVKHLTASEITELRGYIYRLVRQEKATTLLSRIEGALRELPTTIQAQPMREALWKLQRQIVDANKKPEEILSIIVAQHELTADEQVLLALIVQPGQGGGLPIKGFAPTPEEIPLLELEERITIAEKALSEVNNKARQVREGLVQDGVKTKKIKNDATVQEMDRLVEGIQNQLKELYRESAEMKLRSTEAIRKLTPKELAQYIKDDLPVRAQLFKANLISVLKEHLDQIYVLAVDSDIGGEEQNSPIDAYIYKAIRQLRELKDANGKPLLPNLRVVWASGQNLVSRIDKLKEEEKINVDLNNVFVVAQEENIKQGRFNKIVGQAWITAIDDSNAKESDYMPIFESVTLNIMARLNADVDSIKRFYDAIADKPIDAALLKDMKEKRLMFILPRMGPRDSNELPNLYELSAQLHISA